MAASDYITNPQITGPGINMAADLYKMISGIPDAYQSGVEQRYKRGQMARTEELQKPISFIGPDGKPDLAAGLQEYIKRAGAEGFEKLYPALQGQQSNEAIFRMLGEGGSPDAGGAATSRPSNPAAPYFPPERRVPGTHGTGTQTEADMDRQANQADNFRQLATEAQVDIDNPKFKEAFRGVPLDEDLDPRAVPALRNALEAYGGRFGGTPPSTLMPHPVRQIQAQIPREQIGAPPAGPASTPVGDEAQARFYEQRGQQRMAASAIYGASPKAAEASQKAGEQDFARAKAIRDKMAEYAAPTTAQKEYHGAKLPDESLTEFEARRASEKAGAADAEKEVSKFRTAGIDAIGHKAMLDAIGKLGEKVGYGVIPKIQSELGKLGIETKGLSDIQAYERAIDYMAPRLRPEGQGKLLGTELTAFKASLGGLMTTPEGRKISIDNLKLLADYEENIGRVANRDDMTTRQKMQAIYNLPPPRLKSIADVAAGSAGAAHQKVTDKKTYDALPRGHVFVDENGKTWQKP